MLFIGSHLVNINNGNPHGCSGVRKIVGRGERGNMDFLQIQNSFY